MPHPLTALAAALALTATAARAQDLDELAAQQAEAIASGQLRVLGEPLRSHSSYLNTVALTADGSRCVSASWDGLGKVWDLTGDRDPVVLRGYDSFMMFAYFAADDTQIVTAGHDGTMRIFDADTGEEKAKVALDAVHQSGRVAPDGRRLASGDQNGDVVEIRDLVTLEVLQTVPFAGSMQTCCAWSPDGRYLVVGGTVEPKLVVFDTEAGEIVSDIRPSKGVRSLSVRGDGLALAVGGYDLIATYPFPQLGDEPSDSLSGPDSFVRGICWKDPRTVIFGDDDGGITCLDLEEPSVLWSVHEHRDTVAELAMSADGQFLASASHDETIRFWSVADGTEVHKVAGNRDFVKAVAWSPDGARIVAGDYGNMTVVYDAATGMVTTTLFAHEFSVVAAGFTAEGLVLSAAQDDTILLFGLAGDVTSRLLPLQSEELPMMISGAFDGGGRYAGAFEDGAVRIYDASTGAETLTVDAHDDPVVDVAWSNDRSLFASSSAGGTIELWKADGEAVATLAEDLGAESEICFAGDRIVAGDAVGILRVFDAEGRKLHEIDVKVIEDEEEAIQEVCASPDGELIAALTALRITLWAADTGELVAETNSYTSIPSSGAFSPDGQQLAVGVFDSTVLLWDVAKLIGE